MSNNQTQTILSALAQPVFILRMADGEFLFATDKLARIINETSETVVGKNIADYFQNVDDHRVILQLLKQEGNIEDKELNITLKDGKQLWVMISTRQINYENENAVLVSLTDITARKLAEEAQLKREKDMRERETLLRTIIDSTPDWIFVKDREHRYQMVNQGYANSFNMTPEDFIGKNDLDIGFPEEIVKGDVEKGIRGFWADDLEIMESGQMKVIDIEPAVVDGEQRYLNTIKAPLKDANGEVTAVIGFVHDITNRVKIEDALAGQARELQIITNLATTVATTRDQEQLLQTVVDVTTEQFNYYHAQIYLLNAQKDQLILAFGAGNVGRKLVDQKHKIGLNASQSLVAQAARSGNAVVVNDVRSSPDWLVNKLLPKTRAETAVPMMVGDQLLGVLDVQSEHENRFAEQEVQILTTLAAQVSIALANARSFDQAQTAVAELDALTRRLTREGWEEFFGNVAGKDLRFLFDGETIIESENQDALSAFGQEEETAIVRSIEVHGVPIGNVAVLPEDDDPELDVVIGSVMQQLAAHIENLRLTEQVQTSLAQTEALYSGSERIVLSATEADILESLIFSTELRNLDRANIFLFNEPVEDGEPRDVTAVAIWENEGVPRTVEVGTQFTVDQVPFIRMISPERTMVVSDIYKDERIDEATRKILEQYGMISFVLFPMVVGSQWLGMVSGQSATPLQINDVQRRQASSLVSQASVVLQTTILFRQEQARARREQLLREIGAKVRSSVDVDTVMRTAVMEIGRTLGRRAFIELGNDQPANGHDLNGAT